MNRLTKGAVNIKKFSLPDSLSVVLPNLDASKSQEDDDTPTQSSALLNRLTTTTGSSTKAPFSENNTPTSVKTSSPFPSRGERSNSNRAPNPSETSEMGSPLSLMMAEPLEKDYFNSLPGILLEDLSIRNETMHKFVSRVNFDELQLICFRNCDIGMKAPYHCKNFTGSCLTQRACVPHDIVCRILEFSFCFIPTSSLLFLLKELFSRGVSFLVEFRDGFISNDCLLELLGVMDQSHNVIASRFIHMKFIVQDTDRAKARGVAALARKIALEPERQLFLFRCRLSVISRKRPREEVPLKDFTSFAAEIFPTACVPPLDHVSLQYFVSSALTCTPPVELTGWAKKEGSQFTFGFIPSWKVRYMVVTSSPQQTMLSYYTAEGGQLKGIINLSSRGCRMTCQPVNFASP